VSSDSESESNVSDLESEASEDIWLTENEENEEDEEDSLLGVRFEDLTPEEQELEKTAMRILGDAIKKKIESYQSSRCENVRRFEAQGVGNCRQRTLCRA
jgi:hypothetical protein